MEEISLREYIEVLLRGKKWIGGITAAAILASGVVSYTMPSVYEATTTLLANPIGFAAKEVKSDGINDLIDAMSRYPQMDVVTYKEQFTSPVIIQKTIDQLQLTDNRGEPMKRRNLIEKINLEIIEKTNLIRVRVSDQDPELASEIANSLSSNFIEFISDKTREQGLKAAEAIEEQLKLEQEKLDAQAQNLKDYLANSRSIEELKSEVNSLIEQITEYKAGLNDIQRAIIADREALEALSKGRGTATGIDLSDIKVNVPFDGDANGQASIQEIQIDLGSANALQSALITVKATEVEARLIQNISQQESSHAKIEDMKQRLAEAQSLLAEEEYKYNAIQREYTLAEQAYNAYQQRHKEAVITAASDIGKISIQISSPAVVPNFPVSPRRALNVAIAAVLGFMLSVFMVFFKEYWKNSGTKA